MLFGETINEDLPVLLEKHSDKEKIKNVFRFMERMATEGDILVQELLSTTILERLGDSPKLLEVAAVYMGDKTKIALDEIETFWGRK